MLMYFVIESCSFQVGGQQQRCWEVACSAPSPRKRSLCRLPLGDGSRPCAADVPAESVRVVPIRVLTNEMEPELERLLPGSEPLPEVDEVARPLSPTRLQPVLPAEAQKVPEFEEVARVLAEMPRPLKRRGSLEQGPSPALPPTHKKQYQQIINRLFHHHHPRQEDAAVSVGEAVPVQADLTPISETMEQKVPASAVTSLAAVPAAAPQSPAPATATAPLPAPPESPVALTPLASPVSLQLLPS